MKKEIDILDCAREIKKYCKGRACIMCEFCKNDGDNLCLLSTNNPIGWKISEKQILDDKEKQYLWNVIKPFKDKVGRIVKIESSAKDKEFISISIVNDYSVTLPNFKSNTMYKGMELNRIYTLEELGL